MKEPTIYRCPFCGHEDVEIDEIDMGVFSVICPECETIGPASRVSVEDAILKWNWRMHAFDQKFKMLPDKELLALVEANGWK